MTTSCTQAIRHLAAGHLADAKLPPSCTLADATAAITGLGGSDSGGNLGTSRAPAMWRGTTSGVAGERLRLWHDGSTILAVELEAPQPVGGWDKLRDALGPPDAKLPYWKGVNEIEDGQWVFASRGLAVFTALADTELVRVIAFPPTTVSDYHARLARGLEPPREFRHE